jgi:hypothetical protein
LVLPVPAAHAVATIPASSFGHFDPTGANGGGGGDDVAAGVGVGAIGVGAGVGLVGGASGVVPTQHAHDEDEERVLASLDLATMRGGF